MSVISMDSKNFAQEVLVSEKPVLVDFYASWCTPCKLFAPILEQVAEEHPEVKVIKVNINDNQELAEQYQITNIPALLLFKDGQPVKASFGLQPKNAVKEMLQ